MFRSRVEIELMRGRGTVSCFRGESLVGEVCDGLLGRPVLEDDRARARADEMRRWRKSTGGTGPASLSSATSIAISLSSSSSSSKIYKPNEHIDITSGIHGTYGVDIRIGTRKTLKESYVAPS